MDANGWKNKSNVRWIKYFLLDFHFYENVIEKSVSFTYMHSKVQNTDIIERSLCMFISN